MSTKLESGKPNSQSRKVDAYIETQLARTSSRIRWQDALNLLLTFGILLAGYAVVMMGLDQTFHFSSAVRLAGLVVFGLLVLGFLAGYLLPFLTKRLNPYYAAQQIEQTLPDAKESLINWLDLKDQPIPAAFRGALGTRAVQDLRQVDMDQVVESRKPVWLGSILGVLALGIGILFLSNPAHFPGYVGRMVNPLGDFVTTAETQITVIEPKTPEHFVLLNTPVKIRARIDGHIPPPGKPDAPHVEFRYSESDPYIRKSLEQLGRGDWEVTLSGDEIRHGIDYRITAGEGFTDEYKILARAAAQVVMYEVHFNYPEYLHRQPETISFSPNDPAAAKGIEGYEGTEVTVKVKTNRAVHSGILELSGAEQTQNIAGTSPLSDPEGMEFPPFTLRKDGLFRVLFVSKSAEKNIDLQKFPIKVVQDKTPLVELTAPGRDVALPANGTLEVEGSASDDIGIQSLRMQLRIFEDQKAPVLLTRPYRDGKSFQLADKTYDRDIQYRDFLALEKVQLPGKELKPLPAKTKIEYWLEAVDTCTYPPPKQGNVGESKHYWVSIEAPDGNQAKQDKVRKDAEAGQKDHQSKQDQAFAKHNETVANSPSVKQEKFDTKVKEFLDSLNQGGPPEEQKGSKKNGDSKGNSEAKPEPQKQDQGSDSKDSGKSGADKGQKSSAKGPPETKQEKSQAKDQGQGDQPGQVGEKNPPANQDSAGKDKGNTGPQDKQAESKPGSKDDQQTSATKGPIPDENLLAESKGTPQDGPDSVKKGTGNNTNSAGKQPGPVPSPQHQQIVKLDEQARSSDPDARKKALDELEALGQKSSDPEIKKAAQDTLKNLKEGTGNGQPNGNGTTNENKPGGNSTTNQSGNANAPGTNNQSSNNSGPTPGTVNGNPGVNQTSPGNGNSGNPQKTNSGDFTGTSGNKSPVQAAPGIKANENLSNLIGNLQLETVDQITPDLVRHLPWTEKEKNDFLNQLKAQLLQAQAARNQAVAPGAGTSNLNSTGVTPLANPNAKLTNPGALDEGMTPPEYQNAYQKLKQVSQGK